MKIASFLPSLSLIHDLIYTEKDRETFLEGTSIDGIVDDIVLKDVTFSYGNGKPVFRNLNITIPKGKITALVGPSGIGKSTIADLILRLFVPQKGKVMTNGRDIREFSLESWRQRIGYVSQEPYIFNVSVKENILMGRPGASDSEVFESARKAYIHDFVQSLPDGYDSVLGDKGANISRGQRQRLAIARVILRDPDVYIFDEATSSLDSESEKMIQKSIEALGGSKTILIIAHRYSTLENSDLIYHLDSEGNIRLTDYGSLKENT